MRVLLISFPDLLISVYVLKMVNAEEYSNNNVWRQGDGAAGFIEDCHLLYFQSLFILFRVLKCYRCCD